MTQSFSVKAEPTEGALPPLSHASGQTHLNGVKNEVVERALPTTANLQTDVSNDVKVEQTQQPVRPTLFTVYDTAEEILHTPETALKEGLGMVKTIKNTLKQLELGSKLRQEVWDRELANLEGQGTPKTLIAVCGATGAGKSSIMNALLDDNVVPTSGMRACTAVVTELAYHKKSTIDADISFLSENEWREELKVLLQDLVDDEGTIKRANDLKSDAGVAWSKVHAVYPKITQEDLVKMSVDQIIGYDQHISRILGTVKTITANDSKAFAKEIGKYIDSKDQKRGPKEGKDKPKELSVMDKVRKSAGLTVTAKSNTSDADSAALWPLIRQVNVRCSAKALSTGAVLVDLPGVADANAARNNIAKDYMKKCNCIWILAPITRAVDDKTARDLLGDAFKIQLMMGKFYEDFLNCPDLTDASKPLADGNYDDHTITFIATKCDDISPSEVIGPLHLDEDPQFQDIEARLAQIDHDINACKKKMREAGKIVKDIEGELSRIREQLRDDQLHLEALENGESFVSTIKKKSKTSSGSKKRKNKSGGRKGSPKRRRSVPDSDDEDDDFIDDSEDYSSDKDSEDEQGSDEENDSDKEQDSDEGSNNDEDMDDDHVSIQDLEGRIKQSKASMKTTRELLNDARASEKEANASLSSLTKSSAKVQREKYAFCSLRRSEYSRDVLKQDFRTGLKDLDDAAAEERDPDNFNPNTNLRDYEAINLPVFTCSSRDYVRIKGQVKGDGKSSCFTNVADTGIPDLQKWCHQLTIASRERSARTFLTHIKTFAHSVQSYVQGIGDVTAIDRDILRQKWESRGFNDLPQNKAKAVPDDPLQAILEGLGGGLGAGLYSLSEPEPKAEVDGQLVGITPRLCTEFAQLVDGCVQELQNNFKDTLEDKCRIGAANAAESSLSTLDEFTTSMHWATYRATLRRHGSFRRDLNVELINPFTRNIAHSWSQVFESDLFASFRTSTINAITRLVQEVEHTAAPGLKDRARLQGESCVQEARVALANTVELVKETMNREQKEVSRCMAPHVQTQLTQGYDTAMLERGTGSVARQKAYFRSYLNGCKDNMFDDGADVILERLTRATEAIGETLDDAMGKLAQKIEVNLAVLWEGIRDDPAQLRARQAVIEIVRIVQEQVKNWQAADKIKQETSTISHDDMKVD